MPNTYSQIYIQIVFAVKGRQHFIQEHFRENLQRYITGIIKEKKQKPMAIYCMPDHTHILVSMNPDLAISDLVRDINQIPTPLLKTINGLEKVLAGREVLAHSLIQNLKLIRS